MINCSGTRKIPFLFHNEEGGRKGKEGGGEGGGSSSLTALSHTLSYVVAAA